MTTVIEKLLVTVLGPTTDGKVAVMVLLVGLK
jgi:hypothetical protein